jgi:hypothetical protein
MRDPLRVPRAQLTALLAELGPPDPQRDLFWDEGDGNDAATPAALPPDGVP